MAYIGKEPIVGNFQVCDAITVVNGQAAYTLQVSSTNVTPESANHMLVSLNGILQAPTTSFSVSGSTLTFASNLITGDVIDFVMLLGNVLDLGVPSDATVTNAKLASGSFSNITDVGTLSSGLTLSDNIVFDTASKGIYLGVTTATAANLLDDYEEGTWTPSIQASGTHYSSVTHTVQNGRYTKVGRLVTAHFRVTISAVTIGSASGNIQVEGLPFTCSSADSTNQAGTIGYVSNINFGLSSFDCVDVSINTLQNTNFTSLTKTKMNGSADGCHNSSIGSATDIVGTAIYFVD